MKELKLRSIGSALVAAVIITLIPSAFIFMYLYIPRWISITIFLASIFIISFLKIYIKLVYENDSVQDKQ
jgi:hypothetical protein